jgi:hypothetical protein
VLFSLAELRQIEQDRIAAEDAERQAAVEAEREAAAEAERRTRREADEARRIAEERERETAEREAAERRREALRIEEAERQARIQADARIAEIRLAREMELLRIEAENKRPLGLKIIAAALIAIAVVLGLVLHHKSEEADRKAAELAATRAEITTIQSELAGLVADKEKAYEARLDARTRAEKEAAAARLAEIEAEIAARNAALERIEGARRPPRRPPRDTATTTERPVRDSILPKGCTPDQPLCGLDD